MKLETIHVVFDGPPSAESGRFVEVETPDGVGIGVGEWVELEHGMWALVLRVPSEDVKSNRQKEKSA